jgi:integrase
VRSLKVCDVDSKRMVLRIEQGKGWRDRNAMLSPRLLELLREWWLIARPQGWLFPGRNPVKSHHRAPTRSRDSSRRRGRQARVDAYLAALSTPPGYVEYQDDVPRVQGFIE